MLSWFSKLKNCRRFSSKEDFYVTEAFKFSEARKLLSPFAAEVEVEVEVGFAADGTNLKRFEALPWNRELWQH